MKNAYALLGLLILIVFVSAYLLMQRADAPVITVEQSEQDESITSEEPLTQIEESMALTLTSKAFKEGEKIPSTFTCDGEDVLPELSISGVPEGTMSLVLVMDDPDAPSGTWAHYAAYNIPPDTTVIPEGTDKIGEDGINSWGRVGYGGPCPPSGEHRYIFRLYAVSGTLTFVAPPTLADVESAAKGMAIETTSLVGRYTRISNQ